MAHGGSHGFELLRAVVVCLVVGATFGTAGTARAAGKQPVVIQLAAAQAPADDLEAPGVQAAERAANEVPVPATAPFRARRDKRILFWGLIAGTFLILCAAVGANDRLRGDQPDTPKPGTKAGGSGAPPGYKTS